MRIDYASRLILSSSMAWQVPKDSWGTGECTDTSLRWLEQKLGIHNKYARSKSRAMAALLLEKNVAHTARYCGFTGSYDLVKIMKRK